MKLICIVLLVLSAGVQAAETLSLKSSDQQTALIELYTSEGCSSCPPADKWLSSLKDDPRLWREIIPMAFHVDYWDYIGWKDPFALSTNSRRQRQHKSERNIKSVYTPGFVLNGKEWRGWFRRTPLSFKSTSSVGVLSADIAEDKVDIMFNGQRGELNFNMVLLGFDIHSGVKRGENAGKELRHDFVVLSHQMTQSNTGRASFNLPKQDFIPTSRYGFAFWVNGVESLIPLQAAGGWLPVNVGKNPVNK